MTRRRSLGPILVLLTTSVLAACRTVPPIVPFEAGTALAVDDAGVRQVLDAYLEISAGRAGLRGSARVALKGPDYRLDRPQRIAVERPARLRFEVVGLFDQLAAILATDGRRFDFFDASTGQVTRGPVTPTLLWDLTKIDLRPDEVVEVLLGSPEPTPGYVRAAAWRAPDGHLALAFAAADLGRDGSCAADPRQALVDTDCALEPGAGARRLAEEGGELFVFDRAGRLVEMRALEPDGVIRYRALFEEYSPLAEGDAPDFPKRITIRSPAVKAEARFAWKRVRLAASLSDRLFSLPEPRGARLGG